jgi:uncharacterized protein (TIGR00661 family)
MKILYGIVGEGMGHATRSIVVLEHLLRSGHEVRVVVSGRAHRFLVERLQHHQNVTIEEIRGLTLRYLGNRLERGKSLYWNLLHAPESVQKNVKVYRKVAEDGFKPKLVISDFESWAAFYALRHRLPVVSIDNIQIINRCRHKKSLKRGFDFRLARLAVKMKMPGANHYLISSFFFPSVRRRRTTLVPPILRHEVTEAKREPGNHVLIYLRAASSKDMLTMLRKLPYDFRVYGLSDGESQGNVTLCPFSEAGFLDDLRTARAVIAGGGFTLMSEAVSLHVPMLSIPIEHQFEQELNARYLEELGYGAWFPSLRAAAVENFLAKTDAFAQTLETYERQDNAIVFSCVDELIERCGTGDKRPKQLRSKNMGSWEST